MLPVDEFMANLNQEQQALVLYLHGRIKQWQPQLYTCIKYRTLFFAGHRNVCYFIVKKNGVDVGFMYGNQFKPRAEFITTNRKQVVSLFFRFEDDVNELLLQEVLQEAATLDEAFAAADKQ